jgi:hypothetical protein
MSEKKPKYTPAEIPESVQETLYTHYCLSGYNYGELVHYAFDATGEQYVCIAQTPVTVSIPPVGDLKEKVIHALEAEKQKQQAEHHKKMFELQEKIDSLLCLTYQPISVNIEDIANELPF